MDTSVQARIFLADQRGRSDTPFLRSFHTFNFGSYAAEGREPVGPLALLNDLTLRAGASLSMQVGVPTDVLLLPLAGGLEYRTAAGTDFLLAGQAGLFSLPAETGYTITNPYETEAITVLELWFSRSADPIAPALGTREFDPALKNTLQPLFAFEGGSRGFIGRYDGRQEGGFSTGQPASTLFVCVLQGVFEVANRLLHERDGLALRYDRAATLDVEALSNDALLLLLDLG